jgi:hypothetical protein
MPARARIQQRVGTYLQAQLLPFAGFFPLDTLELTLLREASRLLSICYLAHAALLVLPRSRALPDHRDRRPTA